jgi:general secretion pathway protein D
MRRFASYAAVLLALMLAVPALADKAKTLFEKGRDAEARLKFEEAYDYFRQAYELKPREVRYRVSFERTRFLAAASHVHQGQILRDGGKLQEALAEFQKALDIDASSFIARQEFRRTQDVINSANAPAPLPPSNERRRVDEAQGPAELTPIDPKPITLNISEDARMIYQTIGQIAGINVLFDPDYNSRRISVKLNNVTLDEALEVISLESRTFWRAVTPNTIFVAADTPTKRRELEQQVLKTFYLTNISQPTELQDVVNVLRTVLLFQKIVPIASQNAIVVAGSPDQIATAEKLIFDLDQARSEVVIDVAVMQVRRDKLRELGIKPPTSASIALQSNVTSSSTTGTTTTTGSTNQINLNKLANLNATDFLVTIPGATATFLMNDSNTKIIQNPQIRASDGQKASLKIGDRIPVATGSFQPGIGGVGINPLVNTQFQYIDVGVNIDITPRVHAASREVTLKMVLEISSVTSRVNIGGIDQPVIGQRKIDHEIRLKEGEINLLGGILEETDVKTLSGIPGLGQIPLLKYFFADEQKTRSENEIVFVLVPHIVRGQDLTALNLRALDIGTGGAIELRRRSTPAAPSVTQPVVPSPPPVVTQPPGIPPATAPSTAAGAGTLTFDPAAPSVATGATFVVNIVAQNAQDVSSLPLQLSYDPAKLQLLNVSNASLLSRDGQAVVLTHREDETTGTAQISASRPISATGVSGDGPVFTLTFMAKAPGQSSLVINRAAAKNPGGQTVPMSGSQATVTIH